MGDNDKRVVGADYEDALDSFEFQDTAWLAAIKLADCWKDKVKPSQRKKTGDTTKLVDLLSYELKKRKDKVSLTRDECKLLIDLLARHSLKPKRGGQKLPIYKRLSWTEFALEDAAESVRYYMKRGFTAAKAVQNVAKNIPVNRETLLQQVQGKLGSARRRRSHRQS